MSDERLSARPMVWSAAVFVAVVLLVVAAAWALLGHWQVPPGGPSEGAQPPAADPPFALQTAPQPDHQAYLRQKQTWLNTAAWLDARHQVARIPLAQAIDLMADTPAATSAPAIPATPASPASVPSTTRAPPAGPKPVADTTAPAFVGAPATPWPQVRMTPHPGAQLPLALGFADVRGHGVRLARYFDGHTPVVLVLGYAGCRELCGTLMHQLLQSLQMSGLSRAQYRLLHVSIDPTEPPAQALASEHALLSAAGLNEGQIKIDSLVGEARAIATLAASVGFGQMRLPLRAAASDTSGPQFAHPVGFVVTTPDGRIARYFTALQPDPGALRRGIEAAARGHVVGDATRDGLVRQVLLRCVHVDPSSGRHTGVVLRSMQAGGSLLAVGLLAWLWRHRRPDKGAPLQEGDA